MQMPTVNQNLNYGYRQVSIPKKFDYETGFFQMPGYTGTQDMWGNLNSGLTTQSRTMQDASQWGSLMKNQNQADLQAQLAQNPQEMAGAMNTQKNALMARGGVDQSMWNRMQAKSKENTMMQNQLARQGADTRNSAIDESVFSMNQAANEYNAGQSMYDQLMNQNMLTRSRDNAMNDRMWRNTIKTNQLIGQDTLKGM